MPTVIAKYKATKMLDVIRTKTKSTNNVRGVVDHCMVNDTLTSDACKDMVWGESPEGSNTPFTRRRTMMDQVEVCLLLDSKLQLVKTYGIDREDIWRHFRAAMEFLGYTFNRNGRIVSDSVFNERAAEVAAAKETSDSWEQDV